MKAVEAHLADKHPDRVAEFKTKAQAYAKKIVTNFKDYEFVCKTRLFYEFTNKALVHWRENGPRWHGSPSKL